MRKIFIVTETGGDLLKKDIEDYGIHIVPMHVLIEGKSLNDGAFPTTEIFESYKRTKRLPTTSATNPSEYRDMFERLHTENPDALILHLSYSAVTTATFQNSIIGSENMDFVVHIDTKGVTGGQRAVVLKAAEYIKKHPDASMQELIDEVEYWIERSRFAFFPGDLEYLKAGGRVSNAAYLAASLLGLRPLIEINDGRLVGTKKYRGSSEKIYKKLVKDYLSEHRLEKDSIFYVWSQGLDEGLKAELTKIGGDFGYDSITWVEAGGVISTHSGPGAFGIGGFEI